MKLGILSDLHCEIDPAGSRWINEFASERLDAMTDEGLVWFREADVDVVVVLGDLVQFPRLTDLEHAFARLAAGASAPLAVVSGNHDLRLGEDFALCARRHGMLLLAEEPFELDGVELRGVALERGPRLPQYLGRADAPTCADASLVVVASHFPVLSQAERVAAAGLPYAGDLANRADLEARLESDGRPTVVVSGHIHARSTAHDKTLLQFTAGAVIEPPFDATIIEIERGEPRVRRQTRRLGPVAAIDPVFAPEEECWTWEGHWVGAGAPRIEPGGGH